MAVESPTVEEYPQTVPLYTQAPVENLPTEPTALLLSAADQLRVESQHANNPIWNAGETPQLPVEAAHRQGTE